MRPSFKITFLCLALIGLCFHFGLVFISANPYKEEKKKIDYYAQWYVYPYFSQNWNVFVPPPDTNYKLFVEYEDNGKKEKDIFAEILLEHQANRLTGYGTLLLAFVNSIHYFEKNTRLHHVLNGPVKNDLYFQIIEKSALNYIRSTRKININSIQMKLVVQTIGSNAEKVYFN